MSVTSFFVPLIITVVCYSSVRRIACHVAREEAPTTVGKIEPLQNHVIASGIGQENRSARFHSGSVVGIEFQSPSQMMLLSNQIGQSDVAGQLVRFRLENSFSICPISFSDNSEMCRIDVGCTLNHDCHIATRPSRENSRLKVAWTSEGSQGCHLTVIPEENEGFHEDGVPSLKDERSPSHFTRVREWMTERLSNKEKADTQRQRK